MLETRRVSIIVICLQREKLFMDRRLLMSLKALLGHLKLPELRISMTAFINAWVTTSRPDPDLFLSQRTRRIDALDTTWLALRDWFGDTKQNIQRLPLPPS